MAIPIKYNLRSLRVRWITTLLTALGIAVVTGALCVLLALAKGLERAFVSTGRADNLLLLRSGASSETQSTIDPATYEKVVVEDGIRKDGKGPMVSPELLVVVNQPKKDGGKANLTVRGVTPRALDLRDGIRIDRMFRERSKEAVIGRGLLHRFQGVDVGSVIRIKGLDLTIVGVLDADGQAYESELWMDVQLLKSEYQGRDYSTMLIRTENERSMRALRDKFNDPNFGLKAVAHDAYYQQQAEGAAMIRGMGWFLAIILGIGAVFGAMNTMYAAVAGRVREIATMRVLGFSSWAIRVSFLLESLFIALLGGAIGAGASLLAHDMTTGTANWQTFSEIAFKFRVTPDVLASGLFLAAFIGVIGGVFPASRAAKVPLSHALREL